MFTLLLLAPRDLTINIIHCETEFLQAFSLFFLTIIDVWYLYLWFQIFMTVPIYVTSKIRYTY